MILLAFRAEEHFGQIFLRNLQAGHMEGFRAFFTTD